jgi:hypothetical protein
MVSHAVYLVSYGSEVWWKAIITYVRSNRGRPLSFLVLFARHQPRLRQCADRERGRGPPASA